MMTSASVALATQPQNTAVRQPVFALIDCNNFFVSCERLFRPHLNQRPVAVLSNNDGCVVARSNEVKALGIAMGEPYFKRRDLLAAHNAVIFSANFPLYGDIAQRVSDALARFSPNIVIYSIDEAFLQIDGLSITDYDAWAKEVSRRVGREVGIPVSVGVGPSKTLAKLAVERVKKTPGLRGGYSLAQSLGQSKSSNLLEREQALRWLPLEDIWGVGRRTAPKLHRIGLRRAYDLTRLNDEWVLKNLTITGLRTVRELRGESCIALDEFEDDNHQKSLSVTRSFGRKVSSLAELEAAVASFAARAATRLRRKEQLAWRGVTFLRRQSKIAERARQVVSAEFSLRVPSSYNGDIIKGAHQALQGIYDPNFRYEKSGVILTSLVGEQFQQLDLFADTGQAKRLKANIDLMRAMDDIDLRYGKKSVVSAAEVYAPNRWKSRQNRVGPAFTTDWQQLPVVRLG